MSKRVFVTPYLSPEYLRSRIVEKQFDEIIYPFENKVIPRYAISKRNIWLVNNSDLIIAFVGRSFGGAAKMLAYAKQKKKNYINLY